MTEQTSLYATRLVLTAPEPIVQEKTDRPFHPMKGLFGFLEQLDRPPVAAEEIFGRETRLIAEISDEKPSELPRQHDRIETASPFFQAFVLLVAVVFVMLTANRRQEIGQFVADSSNDTRLYENRKNVTGILGLLVFSGWMSVAVVVIRRFAETDGWTMDMGWKIAVTVAAITLAEIYKWLVLTISGRLVLQDELTHKLILLHALCLGRIAIYGLPFALFYALSPAGSGQGWLWLWGTVCFYRVVLLVGKSLSLFLIKKISILHWFLYLCSVEVFPITLLGLLVNRY